MNMQNAIKLALGLLFLASCTGKAEPKAESPVQTEVPVPQGPKHPLTDGFDFPVGPPDGRGYYNAQPFRKNNHLGDDWNGRGGGNTDFGDPVYAIAHGLVVSAEKEGPGWGNVVRIEHWLGDSSYVESLYAHLDSMWVETGAIVRRGEQIGTIGDADGAYYAHLHLELRTRRGMILGGGYDSDTTGYTDPTRFIREHRPKN